MEKEYAFWCLFFVLPKQVGRTRRRTTKCCLAGGRLRVLTLNPQRRQPLRVGHSLELLSPLLPFSVDVKGRASGTEGPSAQSIAGARDFKMDIPNGSGFKKQPFWTSTGENTVVQDVLRWRLMPHRHLIYWKYFNCVL